eukprot:329847_1
MAMFLPSNVDNDSHNDHILLQVCINKEYELTENIEPEKDVWELAELSANDINVNSVRDIVCIAFKSNKLLEPLFTNSNKWQWKMYSYESTKATIQIEDDDDLQTEVDTFIQSNESEEEHVIDERCLKLRIVFHTKSITPTQTMSTENAHHTSGNVIDEKVDQRGDEFKYKPGTIVGETIEKRSMSIKQAKSHALKLADCIGFSCFTVKKPDNELTTHIIHFKNGDGFVSDTNHWHTYLCPKIPFGSLHKFKENDICQTIKEWICNDINYEKHLSKTKDIFSEKALNGKILRTL